MMVGPASGPLVSSSKSTNHRSNSPSTTPAGTAIVYGPALTVYPATEKDSTTTLMSLPPQLPPKIPQVDSPAFGYFLLAVPVPAFAAGHSDEHFPRLRPARFGNHEVRRGAAEGEGLVVLDFRVQRHRSTFPP